jgi:CheY-like chemotaxis protein
LELGVQVVTGDRTFNIFQDIDAIELGQKWQKQLNEAISASRFLIPIVTPLFFKSDPCRDELKRFIEHEKSLDRDDLILPIYFVTAPVLERPELLKDDPLASEIGSRQRYDWRVRADLPPNDPQIRRAVRELAETIATAIARTTSPVPAAAATKRANDPTAVEVSKLVKSLGQERETRNSRKTVLWVDDRPDNNIVERHAMAAYNIDFVLAKTTGQALAELRKRQFDAIISDMGRPPDSRAGYTLLEAVLNVPSKIAQEQLGHASISTTLGIYTHAIPAAHREAVEAVEARLFVQLLSNVLESETVLATAPAVSSSVN